MRHITVLSSNDICDYERGDLTLRDMKLPQEELFVPSIYIADPLQYATVEVAMMNGWDFTIKSANGVEVQFQCEFHGKEHKQKLYEIANDIAKKHNTRNDRCLMTVSVQFTFGIDTKRGLVDEKFEEFKERDLSEIVEDCINRDIDPSITIECVESCL